MDEKGVKISDLEKNNVLTHNTFYKFNEFCPTLENCLKMANFLKVSINYVLEFEDVNNFKNPYKIPQQFAEKLGMVLQSMKISKRKFCKDTGISEGTFTKWRKGVQPKLSKIISICEYLRCKVDDLLGTVN